MTIRSARCALASPINPRARRVFSGTSPSSQSSCARATRTVRSREPTTAGRAYCPLQALRVVLILGLQAGVCAEVGVLGHVRAVAARRRGPAQCLRPGAGVIRRPAAADPEIADAQPLRRPRELGDLVAVSGERGKRPRERT